MLACLLTEFDPSVIYVGKSNLEFALAYKAIKVIRDFRGAAKTSSQAIDLLGEVKPGFVFIHEKGDQLEYADLVQHISQSCPKTRSYILINSLKVLEYYAKLTLM